MSSSLTYTSNNNNNSDQFQQYDGISSSSLLYSYNQNIDLSLKTSDVYQLSIKNYLNKNFIKAWDLIIEVLQNERINNIDDELHIKILKLYLSLYDLILKNEFEVKDKQKLVNKFHNGDLYNDFVIKNIDDDELYLIVFIIEKSNNLELSLLLEQIDNFLKTFTIEDISKKLVPLKILKLYLFNVLPFLEQYDKLEQLINKFFYKEQDSVKLEYLNKLSQTKKQLKKQKEDELLQEKKERERKEKERKEREVETVISNEHHEIIQKPVERNQIKSTHVILKFRNFFKKYYKQNNSLIMLLLLLIGFIISLKKNRSLILNTLKMIFKVSYV